MKTLIHYTENLDGFNPACGKPARTYTFGWEANVWKNWNLVTCKKCLETRTD